MFCILFHEREGSSPLVKLLDNIDGLDMIFHQNGGIEPFDTHACNMSRKDLNRMFVNLFTGKEIDYNGIDKLRPFGKFFGFKVRQNITKRCDFIDIVNKYNIPVFILYRRSVFDWALSKYHGNARGGRGHAQFDMKAGKIKDLKKVKIDPSKLSYYMGQYRKNLDFKWRIYNKINNCDVIPYEDFSDYKQMVLEEMFNFMDRDISIDNIKKAIKKGCYYEKVHKNYNWITNYQEIKFLNDVY